MEQGKTAAERFGFTRSQQLAVLVLTALLLAGMGIRLYRQQQIPDIPERLRVALEREALPQADAKPAEAAPTAPAPVQASVPAMINLNSAGERELTTLPRIGPALAKRIIAYRTAHGPFKAQEDLTGVKGIGPKTLAGFAGRVTVEDLP